MRIVITTCQAFADTSLPPLVKSLKRTGADLDKVVAYWDGPDMKKHEIELLHTDLRCYEMSGPLTHCWKTFNPFLAIHDTCIAGHGFLAHATSSFFEFISTDAQVGGNLPNIMHCCIGFFDPLFLRQHAEAIEGELNGKGKRAAVDFEIKGRLLQLAGPRYKSMNWGIRDGIRHVDIYKTGNPRWERHFPGLGLYKYTVSDTIEGVKEEPII